MRTLWSLLMRRLCPLAALLVAAQIFALSAWSQPPEKVTPVAETSGTEVLEKADRLPGPPTHGANEAAPLEVSAPEEAPKTSANSEGSSQSSSAESVDASPPRDAAEAMAKLRLNAKPTTLLDRLMSLLGLVAMVAIAWLLSANRSRVDLRLVVVGVSLQLVFGILVLKTAPGEWLFSQLNTLFTAILGFTDTGAEFIFGETFGDHFFAFKVLPTIIFFSSLMTLLYHVGVMQHLVNFMAVVMQKTMGTSGSESLSAAANIFVGQTEAPLVVKPYVATMTNSELMAIMTGGFATVAGGVLAAYVGMLQDFFPDIAGHLLAASVMSAPAALVIAKVMLPETEQSLTRGDVKMNIERPDVNVIDAAARGAGEGMTLALNVGAILLAFLALVAMANWILGGLGAFVGWENLSLELIFGYLFWPVAWIMGIPASDCMVAGRLLGEKMVLNEFVAYLDLAHLLRTGGELSYRSVVILTYALCGFANFGSIAIQLGGIGGIAPSRRHDLARLGLRAMIGGTIAAFMTATVAGLLI